MLKVLDNESDISEAQQGFEEGFKRFVDEKIPVRLGFHGGNVEGEVSWSSELNVWMYSRVIPGSRFWNAFGIGKPAEGKNVSITCEINFPLRGINRRVAGAFVVGNTGDIFVVHRGRIGGGRKGIGKSLFQDNYRGEWIDVEDGKIETTVALVGALNSPRFARQVSQFVFEVDRIKGLVSPASTAPSPIVTPRLDHDFRQEFAGKRQYEVTKQIEAQCDHGLVVNQLAFALEDLGFRVGNDRNRDLYIFDSEGRLATIFEVKTSASTASLYSGVGQLMLYSVDLPGHPRLVLTLPKGVSTALGSRLSKLGIELLRYGWRDDKVVLAGLESLVL